MRVDHDGASQLDDGTGKFDLTRFNERYWTHLKGFLDEATGRGLYMVISIWEDFRIGDNDTNLALRSNVNEVTVDERTFNSLGEPKWDDIRARYVKRLYETAASAFDPAK